MWRSALPRRGHGGEEQAGKAQPERGRIFVCKHSGFRASQKDLVMTEQPCRAVACLPAPADTIPWKLLPPRPGRAYFGYAHASCYSLCLHHPSAHQARASPPPRSSSGIP